MRRSYLGKTNAENLEYLATLIDKRNPASIFQNK